MKFERVSVYCFSSLAYINVRDTKQMYDSCTFFSVDRHRMKIHRHWSQHKRFKLNILDAVVYHLTLVYNQSTE